MRRNIFLQLLPGFIPLFIFILADEIWGTTVGLIVAVVTGIAELVYYRIKDKKFDKFILLDTLLIIVLGLISIVLDNDVFFKIKPALIDVLMCVILGVSAFAPGNMMMNMTQRYMKGMSISDEQNAYMKKTVQVLFWIFLAYTALVFYSVWFMSKEAWAFISGGLFYIIFAVYFVFEFVKNKFLKKKNQEEWLPILNTKGEIIGKALRSLCHTNKEYLHPVIHLHVVNEKGEIYLQKRAMNKKVQPGKWDTAVGGHISFGEEIETGLRREALEELGIKDFSIQAIGNYIWESEIEREWVCCFITKYNGQIIIDKNEISEGKFWSQIEIKNNFGKGIFTPNFEEEYMKFFTPRR